MRAGGDPQNVAVVRKHVFVSGRVQGVFFRAFATREGRRLGLRGWVRNIPDGRVESVVEGEEGRVAEMLEWFHRGSPLSRVTRVEVADDTSVHELPPFEVTY